MANFKTMLLFSQCLDIQGPKGKHSSYTERFPQSCDNVNGDKLPTEGTVMKAEPECLIQREKVGDIKEIHKKTIPNTQCNGNIWVVWGVNVGKYTIH